MDNTDTDANNSLELDPGLEELNRLASAYTTTMDTPPTPSEISRWVSLFSYTPSQARTLILLHRSDLTLSRISETHWSLISPQFSPLGYDREAYEHSLTIKDLVKSQSTVIYDKEGRKWWLVRLGGWLESVELVKEIAGLEELPRTEEGTGGGGLGGRVKFVVLDEEAWGRVEGWIEVRRLRGVGEIEEKGKGEKAAEGENTAKGEKI